MKTIYILFTILISSLYSLAQPFYSHLNSQEISWQDYESDVPEPVKAKYLQQIKKYDNKEYFRNDYGYTNKPSEFAVIDFNGDGNKDIIYYGYLGSEVKSSIFFKNTGSDFEYIADISGPVISIAKMPNGAISFRVREEYGCCYHMKFFISYTPVKIGNRFSYKADEILGFGNFTVFPDNLWDDAKKFNVINDTYKLRYSPIINDDTLMWYQPEKELTGNTISEYTRGDIGYAIADSSDYTGRIWWFVLMAPKSEIKNNILEPRLSNKKSQNYQLGWMSNRYLNALE